MGDVVKPRREFIQENALTATSATTANAAHQRAAAPSPTGEAEIENITGLAPLPARRVKAAGGKLRASSRDPSPIGTVRWSKSSWVSALSLVMKETSASSASRFEQRETENSRYTELSARAYRAFPESGQTGCAIGPGRASAVRRS